MINDKVNRIDQILARTGPGYLLLKGAVGLQDDAACVDQTILPVLVSLVDRDGVGFDIDRLHGTVVMFWPNQPSVITGFSLTVVKDRMNPPDLSALQVFGLLQVHGKALTTLADDATA